MLWYDNIPWYLYEMNAIEEILEIIEAASCF